MTVGELKDKLEDVDDNLNVVMSIDEEGNGFGLLRGVDTENSKFDGEDVRLDHLTPELEKQGYTDEDIMEDGERVVVLWP